MKKPLTYDESIAKFNQFVKLRNSVGIALSAIVFVCYYAFVLSIGLIPDILGYTLGPSSITLGIIIGLFLIVLCIVVTGIYTFFANKHLDKAQAEILEDLSDSGALKDLQNGKEY